MRWRYICISIVVFVSLSLEGCGTTIKVVQREKVNKIMRVAVFPFRNLSGKTGAERIVSGVFVTELFKDGRFKVVEPGNINDFIYQEWIDTFGEIDKERLRILGRRYKVDAVITGTVEEFRYGIRGAPPVVAITARMIKTSNGRIMWSAYIRRTGIDYIVIFEIGRVRSVILLTQKVVREILHAVE